MFANVVSHRNNTVFATPTQSVLIINTITYHTVTNNYNTNNYNTNDNKVSNYYSNENITNENITNNNITNENITKEVSCHEDNESDDSSHKFNFDLWDTFTDVIHAIYHLLVEFSQGEFEHVASKLSMDYYNSISEMLLEVKMDPLKYPEYELVRATLSKSFVGLFQARNLYLEYLEEKNIAEALKSKAEILDNIELLKEYIQNNMNQNTMADIFPPANITTLPVIIKPEYLEYIKLYGFPENALFDTDKLADILLRMGIPDHYSEYSQDSSGSVHPDPETRCELKKELVESIEFDFSGMPLVLGKAPLTVHSTGQEILDFYGVQGHGDASGVYDVSGRWHPNPRYHEGGGGCDDDCGSGTDDYSKNPYYTW